MARSKANSGSGPKAKSAKPTATIGKPTKQSAADKAATAKANKNPKTSSNLLGAKTPVKSANKGFAGSGSPLGTSFKLSQPTKPSNIAKAAGAAAAIGAATGYRLAARQVVSEGTKKLQRELSKSVRSESNKDIRSMPRAKREEIAFGRSQNRLQSEADFRASKMEQQDLRSRISESMKNTTKTKKVIKKR